MVFINIDYVAKNFNPRPDYYIEAIPAPKFGKDYYKVKKYWVAFTTRYFSGMKKSQRQYCYFESPENEAEKIPPLYFSKGKAKIKYNEI